MALQLGSIAEDGKPVVIGLDFGTAYSGIAIAFRGDPNGIIFCAPGITDSTQTKVPTALLRLLNGSQESWEFGHRAETLYRDRLSEATEGEPVPAQLFKGFKMLLQGQDSGYDSIKALSVCGASHSLMELITEVLRVLKVHALERVALGHHQGLNPAQDIQWVLTVPAIWNHFGKVFMRKAALKAGLIERELSDNLILALEPESAALAVHAGSTAFSLLDVGSRFMVLDSGGGTVDITVHEVMKVSPLKLRSLVVPTGGSWGGDFVNLEFKKFLKELLGVDESTCPVEFYNVNSEFDKAKMVFDPASNPMRINIADLLASKEDLVALASTYNTMHPSTPILITNANVLSKGILPMSKELMLSFFEPVLAATVKAVREVLHATPKVGSIVIVGGFGSSKAVTARIRTEFHGVGGIRVIMPDPTPKPQGAIVQGAVYFGLYKNIIDSRLSPFTYGIASKSATASNVFHILVRRGQELPVDHSVEIGGMPHSVTQKVVTWRVFRSDLDSPITVLKEPLLGRVNAPCPPHEGSTMRLQRAQFRFGGTEIKVTITTAFNEVYETDIQTS